MSRGKGQDEKGEDLEDEDDTPREGTRPTTFGQPTLQRGGVEVNPGDKWAGHDGCRDWGAGVACAVSSASGLVSGIGWGQPTLQQKTGQDP